MGSEPIYAENQALDKEAEKEPDPDKDSESRSGLDEEVGDAAEKGLNKPNGPQFQCLLPDLNVAPKLVECVVCKKELYPEEEISCSVRGCQRTFHLTCAKENFSFLFPKNFKCPQHACFLCKKKHHLWRCIRCPLACHDKCAPFPEYVVHFPDRPGEAMCWRHTSDWHFEKKEVPSTKLEDIFSFLPIPYIQEEFEIDITWKKEAEKKLAPHPYVQISRNVYLVKRKRTDFDRDSGCTNCTSTECSESCVCRFQCISCTKACLCSDKCSNRPFRKKKKIHIIKTERCGWGVVAGESFSEGDFIIEYVGEVIDDAMCEARLWNMKDHDAKNFYMCEINKNFVIDATFKGNSSRFLNHSCAPNCKLEKWQVEGETRVGVFASRSIKVGEPLTYDYRFIQFGPQVECHCGAPNCQGYLGTKRKIHFVGKRAKVNIAVLEDRKNNFDTLSELSWGVKRRRTLIRTEALIID